VELVLACPDQGSMRKIMDFFSKKATKTDNMGVYKIKKETWQQ